MFCKHTFINDWVELIRPPSGSTAGQPRISRLWKMNKYLLFALLNYKRWEKDRTLHECLMLIIVHFPLSPCLLAHRQISSLFLSENTVSRRHRQMKNTPLRPILIRWLISCAQKYAHAFEWTLWIVMNMVVKRAEKEAVVTECIPWRTEWLLNAKLIWVLFLVAPVSQTGTLVHLGV